MDVTDRQPSQPAPGKAGIGSPFAIGRHCPGLPERHVRRARPLFMNNSLISRLAVAQWAVVILGILLFLFLAVQFPETVVVRDSVATAAQIAEACLTMVHSSLTNEVDDIKPDDPRVPEVIRALHPHYIDVLPNFGVEIYRAEKPEEYFLMRLTHPTNTWGLFIAGPSVFPGGGREILRIEHD